MERGEGQHSEVNLQHIVSHAKEYGFIFPSSDIYGALQGVYDYGPYGTVLKDRVQHFWKESLRQSDARVVPLDAAILMHPRSWEASGHLAHFEDHFVDNKDSKKRYRVDHLIEEHIATLKTTNLTEAQVLEAHYQSIKPQDISALQELVTRISCPVSGTCAWGDIRRLKLMFSTEAGATADDTQLLYLRPETAQGIYVNFLNVQKALRLALPFGIAQVGKAFRNELILRQFTFRTREFTQMEMQFFVAAPEAERWFEHWKQKRMDWYLSLGISAENLRFQPHTQLAHYAQAATDIEYRFPFGWKEVEGIHMRGDFDLSQHASHAGKRLDYFDAQSGKHFLPHVVETSAGLDRICLMLLHSAYTQEEKDDKSRLFLAFLPALAPVQVAVFPLLRKDFLVEHAKRLADKLRPQFEVAYEAGGSIGKRYARQDLIGTPFCVTIDHKSTEDRTVTVRSRDDTKQERMPEEALDAYLASHLRWQPHRQPK